MIVSAILVFFVLVNGEVFAVGKESRIIGGSPANVGEFPFAAAIHVRRAQSRFFCGGSIISQQWILTSAQCIDSAVQVTIQIGSNEINGEDSNRLTLVSEHFEIHPQYNSTTLINDVGLIKLRLPILYTDYIRRTYLPSVDIIDRSSVVALGWGQVDNNNPSPVDSLQFVHLAIVPQDECKIIFGNQLVDHMLCVAGQTNEGPCFGDAGSPLMNYLSANINVQIGIWSFLSANGCHSTDPTGYTRVYPYVNWIKNITGID